MKQIENTKATLNKAIEVQGEVTGSALESSAIDYTKKEDGKILILLDSKSGSKTVKILKGNGLQGCEDMAVTVAAGKTIALVLESGKYVNAQGDNKGKLILEGDVDIRVIELP